jgi:hypothetical protein
LPAITIEEIIFEDIKVSSCKANDRNIIILRYRIDILPFKKPLHRGSIRSGSKYRVLGENKSIKRIDGLLNDLSSYKLHID